MAVGASSTSGSSCAASAAAVPSSGPPWTTTASRRSSISGSDVDLDVARRDPHLGEPEAVLLDEVEREDVAAGRAHPVHGDVELERLARRHGVRERRAHAVPDDRVAAAVEPVVGELEPVRAA